MNHHALNKQAGLYVAVLEQALSHLGQGIVLLSTAGDVQFITAVAQGIISQNDGLAVRQGKLVAELEQDNERLQSMLVKVMQETSSDKNYQNFYIHRKDKVRPYWLMVSKLSTDSHDAKNTNESILIVIKDIQANNKHWEERLKAIYRLTNREATFAVLLTEGRNIKEIGTVMSIAEDTARQYLKNCFKKMDVNKQHELVCLALDSFRKR